MESRTQTKQRTWSIIAFTLLVMLCACVLIVILVGRGLWDRTRDADQTSQQQAWDANSAELTIAVSPGMAPVLEKLAEQFNNQGLKTADGTAMTVRCITQTPDKIVEQSLHNPPFQAIAPDSSLWLSQLDRRWIELQDEGSETYIPIGNRRFSDPIRYATSPIVIVTWESVAQELGWPENPVGWQEIQQRATVDPSFKWNHPSTSHASGLLATLAEFYAGAGLTRGLTPEAATAPQTLDYVRSVEATIRFYGEAEDVIVQRLIAERRNFLDAFVAQEQVVISWNQTQDGERLVAIYPSEGTLWADHPLALLELGSTGEYPVSDNQRRTYQAFTRHLTAPDTQRELLLMGYRPADLQIRLDGQGSPFVDTNAVDWRQPQTTLQIPSAAVVEVIQNVWWYTKRPTNVFLVVDTSGSMQGDKLKLTQEALRSFVRQIQGDRDQVGLITFDSDVHLLRRLQPLDDTGRTDVLNAINQLQAEGQTALLDGVWQAYDELRILGDPEAINAIVVMTDGIENASRQTFMDLNAHLQRDAENQVVIFTIGFGSEADPELLKAIAEIGNGQFRQANETDIEELYKVISTYF